jgi:hypothetical protein
MKGSRETNAAIEGGKYRVVVAPLGELPPEEALRDFVEEVRKEERRVCLCKSTWTYAASTCTGNRGLKSRLSLPAMSLRRHW